MRERNSISPMCAAMQEPSETALGRQKLPHSSQVVRTLLRRERWPLTSTDGHSLLHTVACPPHTALLCLLESRLNELRAGMYISDLVNHIFAVTRGNIYPFNTESIPFSIKQ